MDKITLIIPCYNMEKIVEKCISSIKNQSYTNFEAIFVDDGSIDNTESIIKENIKNDKRMHYVYKENGGLSSARNFGLERATGEYVCFIDSDDYIEKDYLKELYESLINNSSDISICYFNRVYDDKTKINEIKPGFNNLIRFPAAWNKLYKISLFKDNDIEFPVGKWYEDSGTFPKLLMISNNVSIVKKPLYNYIQNDSSIMHTYDDRIYDIYDIIENIEDFAKKYDLYEKHFHNIEFMTINHVLVGTVYRSSFMDNFTTNTIKDIVNKVNKKYPAWHENNGINDLPLFFKLYLYVLNKKGYQLIYILLKLFNEKVNLI